MGFIKDFSVGPQSSILKELQNFKNPVPMTDGVRTFAFKPDDDTVYLIGTEVMTVS